MRVSNDPPPDDLMPTPAAAKLAGVSMSSLYRWIIRGHLRAWKRVGRVLVSRADVLALTHPVQPRPQQPRQPRTPSREAQDRWTRETLERFGMRMGPTPPPNNQQ